MHCKIIGLFCFVLGASWLSEAVLTGSAIAEYDHDCKNVLPTANLMGFDGSFQGVLSAVNFQGERQPLETMLETHRVTSCTAFEADIRYANPETGEETRAVKFSGQWDEAKRGFVLTGPLLQGLLRVVRPGQFVVNFETKFAGNPAHCDEMITITNGAQQVIRSVQCFAGGIDGPSLGVRTALGSRVP